MRPVCLLMIFLLFTLLYLIIYLKKNLLILLKDPSREKALLTLHVTTETHFTSEKPNKYHTWSCQNVCVLLDNIFVWFGTKLYRQVVGIPMGTNCAPLVADLFLFCYERDFMMSLSDDKQADDTDAFNTTSRYLDDILNINNVILIIWYVKYTLQSSNLIKPIPMIRKPHFRLAFVYFQLYCFYQNLS